MRSVFRSAAIISNLRKRCWQFTIRKAGLTIDANTFVNDLAKSAFYEKDSTSKYWVVATLDVINAFNSCPLAVQY